MEREISFGQLIKDHRKVLDLTQAELARRVGCATITLRKIEADSLRPSVQIAERLAMALKIPLEERADFVRLARAATLKTPAPPPTPTPPPLPEEIGDEDLSGRAIQGYALGERIGAGGFGAVYRAVQPVLEREVAVKIILPEYADHPDFIRRFEAEAQLVARLEHPHIVPLYDYWREPGAAYLVMRLLRGGSLQRMLQDGPVRLNNFMRMIEQICLALYAAHRIGVIHRDIKPANILLDEDENAYLADFGIAKNLGNPDLEEFTQIGAMIGSPAYVSPEQIRSELVKPQADIYCLGVLTFEMLTGEQPFQGPTPIDYIQQHLTEPFPPLAKYNPDLPPALDPVILRATAKDPADRYPDVLSMLTDVQEIASGVMDVSAGIAMLEASALEAAEIENPYKGLSAFSEGDAADFFGRETLIQELLGCLADEDDLDRFLAVVGPSGSGKSSVVKAGLIPALRRGGLPGSESWFVVDFTPGNQPLEELEAALLRVAVNPPDSLLGQLQESERGLLRAIQRILPPDKNVELVLVIDQFEEVFTAVTDETVRVHFLESLVTAVLDPRSRLSVIITLRADFTDKPLQYVDFGELVRQRTEFVLPLTPDELELAITGPARRVGLILEPGLVNQIIRDVGEQPGTLPLLQYALTELYEHRAGRRLTLAAYKESGGVQGALGLRAEEVYSGLDEGGRYTARQLFLRLVTLGEGVEDTRRRVLRSELEGLIRDRGQGVVISEVIDAFGEARLMSFDRDPLTRGPTVEVAHESLLQEWRRLREWREESRADIRMQHLLGYAASEWLESGKEVSFLLRGSRLDQFEGWADTTDLALTQGEQDYLHKCLEDRRSREAEEAQRQAREAALETRSRNFLRVLVGVLAVAAIAAVALSAFAFSQRGEAQNNAATAQAEAFARATQQVIAEEQADARATQQAVAEQEAEARATAEAQALDDRDRAVSAEQEALEQASIGLASQAELQMTGSNPDRGVLLALEAIENYPYTWQAEHALGQAVLDHKLLLDLRHGAWVNTAKLSPDGTRILTAGDDGRAVVWDYETGKQLLTLADQGGSGNQAHWSPAGDRILTHSFSGISEIWDADSGEKQIELADHGGFFAHWSPDGTRILSTYSLEQDSALVWDAATGEVLFILPGDKGVVKFGAWSPDGTQIATSIGKVYDAESGEELYTLSAYQDQIDDRAQLRPAFSPDGTLLAASMQGGTGKVWDALTGREIFTLDGHPASFQLKWSPSGARLLTAGQDGLVKVWDVASGTDLLSLPGVSSIAFDISPDEKSILTAGEPGEVKLWDAVTGSELFVIHAHSGDMGAIGFLPSGDRITTTSADGSAKVWDVSEVYPPLGCQPNCPLSSVGGWYSEAACSPDGTQAARGFADSPVIIWDLATGEEALLLQYEAEAEGWLTSGIDSISWSPQGDRLLTMGNDGVVRVWDALSGEEISTIIAHEPGMHFSRWSPDGTRILTGSEDGTAKVWETATGEMLLTFTDHNPWRGSWSADGNRILTVDLNSEIGGAKVWDAATGEVLLDLFPADFVYGVATGAWSPDGTRIVTFSEDALGRVWDAESGEELLVFTAVSGGEDAMWSPAGERFLVAGLSGVLKVYDATSGEELLNYEIGVPSAASWSPDGNNIAVSDFDGNLWIFPAWQTRDELIEYAQECCIIRDLTPEERELFGLPER